MHNRVDGTTRDILVEYEYELFRLRVYLKLFDRTVEDVEIESCIDEFDKPVDVSPGLEQAVVDKCRELIL